MHGCEGCPAGTRGTQPDPTNKLQSCAACPTGHVQPLPSQSSCLLCATDGSVDCSDPVVVRISPGFFMSANRSSMPAKPRASRCPLPHGCRGGVAFSNESLCREGYLGPLCGGCTDGHYRGRTRCKLCEDSGGKLALLGVAAGVFLPLAVFYLAAPSTSSFGPRMQRLVDRIAAAQMLKQGGTLLKILLGWYQSLVVLGMYTQLQLPPDLLALVAWLQESLSWLLQLDAFEIVPLECLLPGTPVNFYLKLVVTMILPFAAFQVLLVLAMVAASCRGVSDTREAFSTPQLYRLGFWLLLLLYPQINRTMFSTFAYVELDGTQYLRTDTTELYGVPRWMRFALLSAGGVLVFTLGVPFLLYRVARSVSGSGATPSPERYEYFSLLLASYRPQYWYFEAVDMLRKLLNTSIVTVVMQGTDVQVWFSAICAWLSLFGYALLQPYADPLCNGLQLVALLHLAICHLSATIFIEKAFLAYPSNLGLIMVASTIAVIAAAAYVLLKNVSSLIADNLHLEHADGTPVILYPPDAVGGYHVFLSHCWRFGQDQAATIKAMLTLMLPDCRVFLDVDNLKSIASLEAHIAESDVVCIFLTRRLSPCPYPTW